ncbi:hypothetical protein [Microbacterium hydrocarbonoxydans]|uniref:hypothetical protein n=1 Tax=Microbacterium hydrocarbonoxydans TaxID=273678 RepID=UPI0013D930E1|nr:hypothetical protein [Microbacterium hydrocarbonoxydans]
MTSRQLRLLRAASASSIATLLAAVSHTLAGGPAPHPLLILAVAALLVPPAALLIGSRPSRSRMALTVLVSQAAFHLVFQLLGAPVAGEAVLGGHVHTLDLTALGPATAVAAPDAVMLCGHVVAATLTTLVLWRGESVVRTIAGWMLALLRYAVAPVPVAHERPAPPRTAVVPLTDPVLTASVTRRGPPLTA